MEDLKETIDMLMESNHSYVDTILLLKDMGHITDENESRVLKYILGLSKEI